ncbi:LOW QUALITY PROTEIN: leucine-rich repeat-containing protein 53-like [Acomys russatus]|uniref:LOW QUALITY PROTEIN: leucine-rich repeat-containing protein 53-like n=1 Tax=Acomys russatus TaxID=60746 RepID=UPI0021E32092|nr:LOW QUALITY PROTEIN: leucine-rich repeat-containing protein 53-like [Acomys russatus]
MVQVTAACPASCVVCSQDVTLCYQLTYIVAAPETTRVLILTDGCLSSVQSTNLTLLANLALLSLSRNSIYGIQEGSLHGLTKLRTLSLGNNHIPSSSLSDHTFSKLRSLQVLVLSSNAFRTLRAAWFRNTKALNRLLLDGNQITNLTGSSFRGANLHRLRHLDLSNNFISFIENAFQPLPQLQEVDLSRNMLAYMPDAFTPLKQLSLLSLEGNQWSCTCDLYPLARFLRNFVKSPARTLHNTKDLNCQVFPPAVAAAKSMLRLSETNCDSKGHNLTLALKDRRPLLPGQDVALLTVLGFAGAVGLTCAGLVIFNWKLQQGRANARPSKTLCCRTLDESLCAHEARKGHAVGYCNCHLTPRNETEVMSDVGSRKEAPLSQENSHQAVWASKSTALDASFRELKGRGYGAEGAQACLGDELLQTGCLGPPGNKKAPYDADVVTGCCPKTAEKLSSLENGEIRSQILPYHGGRKIDTSSDTFRSRYGTSASTLAGESVGTHLTNKPWQPPIRRGDNAAPPPRQSAFITSSSSKLWEPRAGAADRTLHRHRVGYDKHHGSLKQSRPTHAHPNTSFTCKYVSWDEFQDFMKEKKPDRREHTKSEKEQIQINRAIEKFLRSQGSKEKSRLSAKNKKAYSTKRVKFQHPDSVRANRLVGSAETPVPWRQLDCETHCPTSLDLRKYANLEKDKEGGERIPEEQALKKRRSKPCPPSEKTKRQNLRIKLDLHPFGKTRVHPEESPQKSPSKRTRLSSEKTARTSEGKCKTKPLSLVSSQPPERSSHAKPTCSKEPLASTQEQTPYREPSGTLRAESLSVGDRGGSGQGSSYPVGRTADGSSSALPQPTVKAAEHGCSHPLCSPELIVNATGPQIEVLGPSPACLGNGESRVLPSQHSRGISDPLAMVSTQYMDQDKLKTNELNQFALSLGDQVTDTVSKDHSLDENQALPQEEQKPGHKQIRSEEKPLMNKFKPSPESVGNCITGEERMEAGDKIARTEDGGSSPVAWTQPHSDLPFVAPHGTPHQQGSSGSASRGDNRGDPPGTQAEVKKQKQTFDERKTNSSAVSWMIVSTKDLSEADPQTHNHRSHCRDSGENQAARDGSEHREAARTVGMPGAPPPSQEVNVIRSEAENRREGGEL